MPKNEDKFPKAAATRSGNDRTAYAMLTAAPLCWAGNIVLARGVVELIPPVSFALWRWSLAFVLLLPFAWPHLRRDWATARRHWKVMLFLSLTGVTGFNTLLYTAMHTTTAINGALIQTAMPAIIVVICLFAFHERIAGIQVFGVALCMTGAAPGGAARPMGHPGGDGLCDRGPDHDGGGGSFTALTRPAFDAGPGSTP